MSSGLSSEEEGVINTVELALDWGLEVTEEMLEVYERLIERRQRLEEGWRQQSGVGVEKADGDCQGQQSRAVNSVCIATGGSMGEDGRIEILTKYADAKARVKYLRQSISKLEEQDYKLMTTDQGLVSDVVACGKKRCKPLKTVRITGYDIKRAGKVSVKLTEERCRLRLLEEELLELLTQAEEYIESIEDIEIRNILSLYYIEDMTWVQVAAGMNDLYGRKGKKAYTDSACRHKHDRFFQKN